MYHVLKTILIYLASAEKSVEVHVVVFLHSEVFL